MPVSAIFYRISLDKLRFVGVPLSFKTRPLIVITIGLWYLRHKKSVFLEEYMDYRRVNASQIDALWKLQKLYKAEIGENEPDIAGKERLAEAIKAGRILFFGAFDEGVLVACCSVTVGFSTYVYMPSGVFEDFYILPEYRHKGIARQLVHFAYCESGVSSLTVGCADCDVQMYHSLGFTIALGNLLAFE